MLKGRKGAKLQRRVPRGMQSDGTLTSKCLMGKEDGWVGRKQGGRQARGLVSLLERRVLSAEGRF